MMRRAMFQESLDCWRCGFRLLAMLGLGGSVVWGTSRTLANSAGSAASERTEKLVSVRLVPERPTLWGANASQRFLVLGRYSDGLERDVTSQSRFSLSNPQLAEVDRTGRLVARADGRAVLTANVGAQSARTEFWVNGFGVKRPFSFSRDILGIFTKRGCNDSSCHGGVKGKGGFKLSLNGLYPRDDYKWIVEGGTYQVLTAEAGGTKTPRVDVKEPEKSSLLLKPSMGIAHGGGLRLSPDSSDYQAVLNWIKKGAVYGEEGENAGVRMERVEVFPKEAVLDSQGKLQLLVTAYYSDGKQGDITDQVLYVSNNPDVVKVTAEGFVEAVRIGETAVMIRAAGHVASVSLGVIAKPTGNYPEVSRYNFIDEHVFAKLKKFNIIPSELSSDGEFLRRVCLDVTGTLPPPERVREFLANKDPQKRKNLIEILLNSPEYIDYWTFRFADIFRVAVFPTGINEKWTKFLLGMGSREHWGKQTL